MLEMRPSLSHRAENSIAQSQTQVKQKMGKENGAAKYEIKQRVGSNIMLPDPLPTNPEELEALYRDYMEQDKYDQREFDRLMEARLRAWGYDPKTMTAEQIIRLMEESINRMLLNLYNALGAAPDEDSAQQVQAIVQQAEELRAQINKVVESDPPSS